MNNDTVDQIKFPEWNLTESNKSEGGDDFTTLRRTRR